MLGFLVFDFRTHPTNKYLMAKEYRRRAHTEWIRIPLHFTDSGGLADVI
jgi:hypothetical protein